MNIPTVTVLMKQTPKMESFEVDPVGSTFSLNRHLDQTTSKGLPPHSTLMS